MGEIQGHTMKVHLMLRYERLKWPNSAPVLTVMTHPLWCGGCDLMIVTT
jgi:hypothetical protein